ncbi:MAG: tRNA (adenine-N1)-methyltransferase [Desulfovibrio sp.]|uniref:tRNA (adenine-N1)-methyltransferase n=1 Tax=Desulfovibrio sp. 7SRBS1 TaxID=3378064 RepID=UPI003B3D3C48
MIETGSLVLLVSPRGKRYMRRIEDGAELHTNEGKLALADVAKAGYGARVKTHMGREYKVYRPTLYDLCKNVKRQTQIIYPKEIGYIIMRLGIGPGMRVVECGSGSGSLTVALSWFVGPTGKIYTYERREEFFKLCSRNLRWAGLDDGRVEQVNHNIEEGFIHTDADALFLDVRTPWEYLDSVAKAVRPGAPVGFLLPTVNQVSYLVEGLQKGPFEDVEVVEILLRRYKTVPDRMRPEDRMVAHTGFLVFARHSEKSTEAEPEAELKSDAAVDASAETAAPAEAPAESAVNAAAPEAAAETATAPDAEDTAKEETTEE